MSKRNPIIATPDLTTRQCRKCRDGKMASHQRRIDFLSVKSVFECPNCQHKTTLDTSGITGAYLAVGLLGAVILSYILWGSGEGYTGPNILKTLFLLALFTAPVWLAAIKTRQYPITGMRPETAEEKELLKSETGSSDPLQRGVIRMDKLSPMKGFLWALIIVAVFLGSAALIGWINFTYFDDQLFG